MKLDGKGGAKDMKKLGRGHIKIYCMKTLIKKDTSMGIQMRTEENKQKLS